MFPLLEIKNLTVDFVAQQPAVRALDDITFTLNRNEILGIAGESGSGKSVTSLSVMRLLASKNIRYVSGEIWFSPNGTDRIDLLRAGGQAILQIRGKDIAMIFQEPMTSLNPVFTCGSQVAEALLLDENLSTAEAKKKTIALFGKVKLPDPENIFNKYPHQISGGQKQRVMIAMAMSRNPSLLICDEPTTALDVTVQKAVLELIRDLQKDTRMGVLFISHDLGVMAAIARRLVIMHRGRILEQGPSESIFRAPAHPYTRALIACRPALYASGTRLPVVGDFMPSGDVIADNGGNDHHPGVGTVTAAVPPAPENVLIRVEDLSVHYPVKRALSRGGRAVIKAVDAVSFDIFRGETLGLVGESGCGKTTLGRALIRLIHPASGAVYYRDTDILRASTREQRRLKKEMQIIFQDPYSSLNPSMTVGTAISEVLQLHYPALNSRQRHERVEELLRKVDLGSGHYNRYPHEFSGGQRQRVVIARALAVEPEFLICDESVSALDLSIQAQILNLLNDLKREFGFTCLFISHDLSVIRYISDRIMVMRQGKLEEVGNAEAVYKHPSSAYTRELLSSMPAAF